MLTYNFPKFQLSNEDFLLFAHKRKYAHKISQLPHHTAICPLHLNSVPFGQC